LGAGVRRRGDVRLAGGSRPTVGTCGRWPHRMLGSLSEADDAVQEDRLRLSRTDTRHGQRRCGADDGRRRAEHSVLPQRAGARSPLTGLPDPIVSRATRSTPGARNAAGRLGRSRTARGTRRADPRRAAIVRAARHVAAPFDQITRTLVAHRPQTGELASRARRPVQGAATGTCRRQRRPYRQREGRPATGTSDAQNGTVSRCAGRQPPRSRGRIVREVTPHLDPAAGREPQQLPRSCAPTPPMNECSYLLNAAPGGFDPGRSCTDAT
jgi:hypothetical protein